MYCGHNKIALASQRQISQALYELMLEKRFAEISISEICRRADVSRQTFYKLYESKENILLDYLDGKGYAPEAEPLSPEENSGTEACSSGRDFCLKSFCCEYSRYLVEKRELLRLLAENNITHLLTDSMYRSMVSCPYFLPDLSPEKRLYTAGFIAGGFTGIAVTYVGRDTEDSAAFLEEEILDLFHGFYLPD